MTGENRKIPELTPGQSRFLSRFASAPFLNIAATAEAVGVKPKTAYGWREDSSFARLCDDARDAKQAELSADAEAELDGKVLEIMRAKIELACYGSDPRAADSAQTWLLEHVLGKRNAVNKLDVTSGGKSILASLEALWDRPTLLPPELIPASSPPESSE